MGFMDSYKRLEKICNEIYSDDPRGVSSYIDDMSNTPSGVLSVPTWEEDLKKLKKYRWIRNQITHEPGLSEHNMCAPSDARWLDDFHNRILNQTDPLALNYKAYKASKPSNTYAPQQSHAVEPAVKRSAPPQKSREKKHTGWFVFLFVLLIVAFALLVVYSYLHFLI